MTVVTIVVSIACFIVGGFASYMFFIPEQESGFGERSITP